jgi:hypothetical protein
LVAPKREVVRARAGMRSAALYPHSAGREGDRTARDGGRGEGRQRGWTREGNGNMKQGSETISDRE